MAEAVWAEVDDYFNRHLLTDDPLLTGVIARNAAAGLPAIDVAPNQGALLSLLARSIGAKRVLEVGTLGGYSTLWLARALPTGGRLITLELQPKHAEVALENIRSAKLEDRVEIFVGPAAESLARLEGPFDFIFVDADKANNPIYWRESLRLARPGALIIVDNVIRDGRVVEMENDDPNLVGIRTMVEAIHNDDRVEATALQTVGSKGYDGFLIARVRD